MFSYRILTKVVFLLPLLLAFPAFAYQIRTVNTEVKNDFVLSPAKADLALDPGSLKTVVLTVTNRRDKETSFSVGIEDFKGSESASTPVILLGNDRGPYSLKDLLRTEISTFTLKPKEMIEIPVTVAVPADASPGGLYGSVLFSMMPGGGSGGGAVTVSRLGALFFVRVNGEAKEDGMLQSFGLKNGSGSVFTKASDGFTWYYRNSGNVHLSPYGMIKISNTLGQPVLEIPVEPSFAMPDSVRYREIEWKPGVLLGRYTAELSLNRGYGNIVDAKSVTFWVLPWKFILGSFGVILAAASLILFVRSKFEIRMKK